MIAAINLKLLRKFLILAVLLGGAYFASAAGITAKPARESLCPPFPVCCCSTCNEWENQCVSNNGCYNYPPGPARQNCLGDCNNAQWECRLDCDGFC